MIPSDFVRKWSDSRLRERQGSQEHFIDLCRMLGEPTPAEDDPLGERYCFERGAEKVGGGDGWADVWRKGCFGWEYKGKHKDLNAALRQLQGYTLDLQNPPYLVVSDMDRIIVHTNWTNTVSRKYEFALADLYNPERLDDLRGVFRGSDRLKPGVDRHELTATAAAAFGELGRRLQDRGHPPREVAHFLNKLVFCMFAEDAELLPKDLFTRTMRATTGFPDAAQAQLSDLFAKMRTGGFFGPDVIRWFNGGLFDDSAIIRLEYGDLELIAETAADNDWSEIDPAIFGTLFEQALKATRERPALGAHYTDREKILKIFDPVIVRPLAAEWEAAKAEILGLIAEAKSAEAESAKLGSQARALVENDHGPGTSAKDLLGGVSFDIAAVGSLRARQRKLEAQATETRTRARGLVEVFQNQVAAFRVLDPACGSGNFLYVALHALRDLEQRTVLDAALMGLPAPPLKVTVEAVKGIEIEPYAAELARVTLWIGNLQWLIRRGYRETLSEPLLSSLDQIENRDALLNADGSEAAWPASDVIVGNPPFLGNKRMRDGLGDTYVEALFAAYKGRVSAEADFVCYWVEKAWQAIGGSIPPPATTTRAGLVTTNSIRGGANRRVVAPISDAGALMEAWADEPWVLDGAAVRVSMLGFGRGFLERRLEGKSSLQINADLTGAVVDLTKALRLKENEDNAFQGPVLVGPFQITGEQARAWIGAPTNPNGRSNADVLVPTLNASDVVRWKSDRWVIDFRDLNEEQASLYQAPFDYTLLMVKPIREQNRRAWRAEQWWKHGENGNGFRRAAAGLARYIISPRVAKYRVFTWAGRQVLPDSATIAVGRSDDTAFGILHSRFHELWSLRMGTWLGVGNDPRYTPSTTFETFPFPKGLTPNIPAADYAADPRAIAIAEAAAELHRLREAWLNPPDLVRIEPEVVPGYPDRILPKDEGAAKVLKSRTLTNLYNQRPAWLDMAHRALDAAVAAAYGWPIDLSDDEILARLFALNQERSAAGN